MFHANATIQPWHDQQHYKIVYDEVGSVNSQNRDQPSRHDRTIIDAVVELLSMGVPPKVLSMLYQPCCQVPLQILLSASCNGFTIQEFHRIVQMLRHTASGSVPGPHRSYSLLDSVQRASSLQSYDSRLSGDTLRSMGIPHGFAMQGDRQPIDEPEATVQVQTLSTLPEENMSDGASQKTSHPESTINSRPAELQPSFDYFTSVLHTQDTSYTNMLQDDAVDQSASYAVDDNDASATAYHDFHNRSLHSMQLEQIIGQSPSFSVHPTISGVCASTIPSNSRNPYAPGSEGVPKFDHWTPRETDDSGHRSPCPFCKNDFKSSREFIAHMKANHDQPVDFLCLHTMPSSRHGSRLCGFTTCRSSRFSRHHNNEHRSCTNNDTKAVNLSCLKRRPNPRPKKVWGCWLCRSAFTTVEDWVSHHMRDHKFTQRRELSHTWLMKSLLSQPALHSWWKSEVKRLEEKTRSSWNIQWDAGEEPVRDELIKTLETGFWKGSDLNRDTQACRDIVAAAMKSTEQTRTKLDPLENSSRHAFNGSSSISYASKAFTLPIVTKQIRLETRYS